MNTRSDQRLRKGTRTKDAKPLANKVCVVTGGSRGIGRNVISELAADGATVVVNFRSSAAAADEVVEAVEEEGGEACVARADVGDYAAVDAMADRVHDEFGGIDVLVNNAGVTVDKRFERMEREDWDRVVDVNLGGAFNCTKAFYEDLKAAPQGRLISVSSVVGQQGNVGQANYAAAKSGLFGFTKTLARELAPYGTTANCVAPGFTMTDMVRAVPGEVQERILRTIPLERFAETEEVACIVGFLASEESSYVTGEIINANGGMYA